MCVLDGKVALVTGASKGIGAGIQRHRQIRPAGPNRLSDALSLRLSIFLAQEAVKSIRKKERQNG
jgi:NAD(P)-dependent dehydrogenase (short-subunit alcohol dehydrogenase family)